MGLKSDIYVKSRDGMSFLFECKTNPLFKGYESRLADKAFADAWRRMKDGELPLDFEKLSEKPLDEMNDKEIVWFLDQIDRASRRIKDNLNARSRYFKYKQRTNL
jgi:hypothetical protein